MHIQIVNFNLHEMSDAEFVEACDSVFAPAFSNIPGLIAKVWLRDMASNTYGGVYAWEDIDAMKRFQTTELFASVANNPHFANLTSRDYSILDGPTRATNGFFPVAALR